MEWARQIEHVIDHGGEVSMPLSNKVRDFDHIVHSRIADLKEVGSQCVGQGVPVSRSKKIAAVAQISAPPCLPKRPFILNATKLNWQMHPARYEVAVPNPGHNAWCRQYCSGLRNTS